MSYGKSMFGFRRRQLRKRMELSSTSGYEANQKELWAFVAEGQKAR